jgi:hypothetical protein
MGGSVYLGGQLGLQKKFIIHNSFDILFDFSSSSVRSIRVQFDNFFIELVRV